MILSESMPAAILFDLDGTLVDSLPDMRGAMNRLLAELGRRPATLAELRTFVGDGVGVLVERTMAATGGQPDAPLPSLTKRFLDFYRGHTAIETRAYPGVAATLEVLKAAGHVLGVCTNKPTELSLELLGGLDLLPLFSAVVGGDAVPARKPDPGHLFATLEAMKAGGRKVLMVGDSPNDVAAARAAGIPVAVVTFGYSRMAPQDLGADVLLDHFSQLPAAAAAFL